MHIPEFKPVKASWPCWRAPGRNLVYWANYKCASTLYRTFFELLGWIETDSDTINWDQDYVFSYIRHPLIKQRKGIVENFVVNPQFRELIFLILQNNLWMELIARITCLDGHSETIENLLGDKSKYVYWIPIDTDIDHKQVTLEILNNHDIRINTTALDYLLQQDKVNSSTELESKFFSQLIKVPVPANVVRYVDFDQCLYDFVTKSKNFIPEKYQTRIHQLKAQGYSQLSAEEIADREVKDGDFLKW